MMNRIATSGLTGLVALAMASGLAVSASAAEPLPQIHLLEGESFPVTAEGVAKGAAIATISTALASPITAEEVKLLLTCNALGSLCPYDLHLVGVKQNGETCHTAGDEGGVVLVTNNEVHFVSTSTSPLDLAAALLLTGVLITCEKGEKKLKLTVQNAVIGKIEGVTNMLDPEKNTFTLNQKCTAKNNGKQEVKEYLGDKEEKIKAVLAANLGLGTETACFEVKTTVPAIANKMVMFLF